MPLSNPTPIIVSSISQPTNLQNNEIWAEQTSDKNIVEMWSWINNKLYSGVKNIRFDDMVTTYNYYFIQPISTVYDLYVNSWESQVYWANNVSDTYTFSLKHYRQPNANDTNNVAITNIGSWTSTGVQSVAKRSKLSYNQVISTSGAASFLVYTGVSSGIMNYNYHFGNILNCNYIRR